MCPGTALCRCCIDAGVAMPSSAFSWWRSPVGKACHRLREITHIQPGGCATCPKHRLTATARCCATHAGASMPSFRTFLHSSSLCSPADGPIWIAGQRRAGSRQRPNSHRAHLGLARPAAGATSASSFVRPLSFAEVDGAASRTETAQLCQCFCAKCT